ncbi:MAG: NAD(P)/FAD-dependent oxidoreductase [Nannocystaceae bacterium]
MNAPSVLVIGGGVAGLATGCYARMSGYRVHLLEHNRELGGVCTAWSREPYLVDGCLRWLIGGAPGGMFRQLYEELGLVPELSMHTLETFARVEDPIEGWSIAYTRDLQQLRAQLSALGPSDGDAIARLCDAAVHAGAMHMPIDAPELTRWRDRLASLWQQRGLASVMLHFRGPLGPWLEQHVRSPRLRAALGALGDPRMPAVFLPVLLGALAAGQLQRPEGGTLALRNALLHRFRELGAQSTTGATVEQILLAHGRAIGVQLADGTTLHADAVISAASAPETLTRLLGGRPLDLAWTDRLERWPIFDAIALVSLGVARQWPELDAPTMVRLREPLRVGDVPLSWLPIEQFAGPPYAPEGHAVVQSILRSRWGYWSELGPRYGAAKQALTDAAITALDRRLPGLAAAVRMTDVATPLTFWRHARSWQGAYEGFLPTAESFGATVPKTVPGIANLWLAGQWVEPGGGIPPALLSGRQAVQLLCAEQGRAFTPDEDVAPVR